MLINTKIHFRVCTKIRRYRSEKVKTKATMSNTDAYRAPFARASDAGCDLPHSLYKSDACL